jgi:hypothetical protein
MPHSLPVRLRAVRLLCALAAALLLAAPLHAQHTAPAHNHAGNAALLGTWKLDLRPTPDAPPVEQEFVVASVDGDSIVGTFYRSPVQNAEFNGAWGPLHVAFTTSDGSGVYHHHAVLVAPGRLEGTTHSLGRGFLMVWRAEKAVHAAPAPGGGSGGAQR